MGLWQIWNNRNSFVFKGIGRDPVFIASSASSSLCRFQDANSTSNNSFVPQCRWQVPPVNWVKINFDAAIFSDFKAIGIGIVIRNSSCYFLAALCKKIDALLSSTSAKEMVVAAAHALNFAQECGFENAWFERDAQEVINLIKALGRSLRPYGHIVDDIKRDLISFGPYNWSFVRRSGNEVPHCLAKHAKFVSNFVSWMEESPEFFLPPLQFESY